MERRGHIRRSLLLLAETVGVLAFLAAAAGVAATSLPSPWRGPATALVAIPLGLWFDRLYTVAHEAVHRKLFPNSPRLNDLVGAALMLPLVAPFTIYRKIHAFHHGANRRDRESAALDHFRVSASAPARARARYKTAWIFYVFFGGFFLHSLATILIFLFVPSHRAVKISPVFRAWHPRLRARAAAEFGLGMGLHAAVAILLGKALYLALLGLPTIVFAWIWSLLLYVYHYRTSVGPDVVHNVRSLPRQPFFSWLLLNFNEHATHHRDPTIPWYALPERRYRLPESHAGNDDVGTLAAAVWQQRRGPVLWSPE